MIYAIPARRAAMCLRSLNHAEDPQMVATQYWVAIEDGTVYYDAFSSAEHRICMQHDGVRVEG